jgi:RimJ/RimL family protein N-acetyltransferase
VARFFSAHYPESIFSQWMLENPFFGLFIDGELVSTGGVIALSRQSGACHIGNFLTPPRHRGKRFADRVARSLVSFLDAEGIRNIMLGANEDNLAARRVYERLGFAVIDRKSQLDLSPGCPS